MASSNQGRPSPDPEGGASLLCPKCVSQMLPLQRFGVTIDQCTGCGGIFLDQGELEQLSEAEARFYAAAPQAPSPAAPPQPYPAQPYPAQPYPAQPHYPEPHYPERRHHGGFFDEFFGGGHHGGHRRHH